MISTTVARWLLEKTDPCFVRTSDINVDGDLAQRNLERLLAAKQALGPHYLLHPSNQISRVRDARPRGAALKSVPNCAVRDLANSPMARHA